MGIRQQIIDRISEFCATHGVSYRKFGVEAVGDSHFWSRLQGREGPLGVTLTRLERAEQFMDEYKGEV